MEIFQTANPVITNLHWVSTPGWGGQETHLLQVSADEEFTPGGTYFLYNPETRQPAGYFLVGGDMGQPVTDSWETTAFYPDLEVHSVIEVRYGDVHCPDNARVVARVSRY
ncbi:hypothetical protein ACIQMR_37285 [Streptomyces sp. NPDC091376]|uniref:hypothetical protein n=1 Tax=Streptomyces sp. NPDC091376 TaxID=3365994 RepID=UPI0037F22B27